MSNGYKLTVLFDTAYTGEFAENTPYEEAEKIVVSWLAQDLLDGRFAVSEFDRKVIIEHDSSD